ncbi:EF-hand domain-containing protein [bacterium]|nr:EF-hand domain-containing protein [bacterium]
MREREVGIHSELVLAYRFQELDPMNTGYVQPHEYILYSLKDALSRSGERALDLFVAWDENGNGDISLEEFRKTIRALGFRATNAELDVVFAKLDFVDNSGNVSYLELHRSLRKQSELPDAGSQRNIAITAHQKREYRRGGVLEDKLSLDAESLSGTSASELTGQLRDLLVRHRARVMDLFRTWDEDGSGIIDRKEFRLALRGLGVRVPNAAADALFDTFDVDHSGELDYREVNKHLRQKVELDEKLRAGAVGPIVLAATNKSAIRVKKAGEVMARSSMHGVVLDARQSIHNQLVAAIKKCKTQMIRLFQEWDDNGDGRISKDEMLKALQRLGLTDGKDAKDAAMKLFRRIDDDNSVPPLGSL